MFDAYTVKKVLPRLVIAVVLIQLSWFIFTGMISLTSAVAYGVEGLIYAPFGGSEALSLSAILRDTDGGVGIFTLMALGGTLGILGVALSLAGTALLGLMIAFAMLMFRQVLVIALLVISPLALAAWILPNTEKFWKLWWESFSKLLLVYPLILAVIAIGRVFAFISADVRPGGNSANLFTLVGLDNIIGVCFVVIGVFGPFFFIPKLFAIAGTAFASITGMANDRSKGVFDRLRKGRQEKRAKTWAGRKERAGRERLFNPNTALGRLNKPASWVAAPGANAAYLARNRKIPFLSGRGREIAAHIHEKQAEQTGKAYQELNNHFGSNDKAYRAMSGAWYGLSGKTQAALKAANLGTEEDGRFMAKRDFGSRDDIIKMQQILSQSDSASEVIASAAIQGAIPRLDTMYADPEAGYANVQAASLIGLASHGFANEEDLAAVGNQMLAGGAHAGDVQNVLAQAELGAARAGRSDIKPGYGHSYDEGAHKILTGSEADRDLAWVETMGLGDIAGAKGGMLESKGKGDLFKEILRSQKDPQAQNISQRYKQLVKQGLSKQQIAAQYGKDFVRTARMVELAPEVQKTLAQSASSWAQTASGVKVQIAQIFDEAGIPLAEMEAPDSVKAGEPPAPEVPDDVMPGGAGGLGV